MVLLRFAPSPTGSLHLGGLRTALLNHLFARKHGGKWLLRIEDTDMSRSVAGSIGDIRRSLEWADLAYDYGPGKGGPHGPYLQSERLDLYHLYTKKLLESGHAYRCFCSPTRLAFTKEQLTKRGSNATYDKACLHLTDEEVARRVRNGEKSVVRLNDNAVAKRPCTDKPLDLVFTTAKDVHAFQTDPILLKSDLFPTYHLASVVDDHEMGITHVFRGEEWLPSLPLHLDIYSALNLVPPKFAHLPILLNRDGSKMSKREGHARVASYIEAGWEPIALLNWLVLAGWGVSHDPTTAEIAPAPDSTEMLTMPHMVERFDLNVLTSRRITLDPVKLELLNKKHIERQINTPDGLMSIAERAEQFVRDEYPSSDWVDKINFVQVILALETRLSKVQDFSKLTSFLFVEPDYDSEGAKRMRSSTTPELYTAVIRLALDVNTGLPSLENWDETSLKDKLHHLVPEGVEVGGMTKLKMKDIMLVLRHALAGKKDGLAVATMVKLLGKERTLVRLNNALGIRTTMEAPRPPGDGSPFF